MRVRFCVEQFVISRQHKECPNRDATEGECDVGPSDASEQYIYHSGILAAISHLKSITLSASPIRLQDAGGPTDVDLISHPGV
jgi:hypothetical protein